MSGQTVLIIMAVIILLIIYLLFDFILTKGGANQFWDKWAKRTLWLWLPFYALQRLVREVIFKK